MIDIQFKKTKKFVLVQLGVFVCLWILPFLYMLDKNWETYDHQLSIDQLFKLQADQ